jgi:hypothetical protein
MKDPKAIEAIRRKDVPNNIKIKAVTEARLIAEQNLANFFDVEDICGFADWAETPSGYTFWSKICDAKEQDG